MGRAPCCDKANVKKGPWSPEEDAMLKEFIGKYGTAGNWISLPQKAGLRRCGKSCRLRWLNYLRPNIKHGEFSEEEDRVICTLYATIGSRWSIIASQLPGRTDNDIKNYWNTKLKKKLMGYSNFPSNHTNLPLPLQNSLQPTPQFQAHTTMMPTLSQLFRDCSPFTTHHLQAKALSSFESSLSISQNFLINQTYGFEMQDGLLMNPGIFDNMVIFGGNNEAASCSSSSDGSCSKMSFGNINEIKKESMSTYLHYQGYPSNGYEDDQRLILDYGATSYGDVLSTRNLVNLNHELLHNNYDNLEEVNELLNYIIINRSRNNNNSSVSYYFNDEKQT
ncbi:hypothetical protein LIER_01232 [Lithospermum erythrorhizon]|uniref:Uncharacterized protein n=1 Tax=Lithospermum erythrorhizon TaxID=34254 RepID=A0AAV3NMJ5_LITER